MDNEYRREALATVLVVDDEPDIREVLQYNLRSSGHEPVLAATGKEGLELCRRQRPDLVILDVMLPDISGTEICSKLKADPSTRAVPIIMLSARGDEVDRVVGLELGADDYLTKPFSVRELLLRVRAVLRRPALPAPSLPKGRVDIGRLSIDRDAHRVLVDSEQIDLTPLEFKLLVTLCERRDRVQSRSVLVDDVWGVGSRIEARTVDAHVKRLRDKLRSVADYIQTVRGVGYRFTDSPP
jgi:two-component system phosphate regulon response regulator PhoB